MYIERLLAALRELPGVEPVEARQRARLAPGRAGGRRNPARSAANAALDLAWLRLGLPRAARAARAQVLHHPLPAYAPGAGCAQAVTVHDLAFERLPASFDPMWRSIASRTHRTAVARADAVICVSRATAADAKELLGADPSRLHVAHHGPGQALPPVKGGEPKHFLYVGSDEPRKDVAGLVDAYARYRAGREHPLDLVLAGQAARRAGPAGVRGEPDPGPELLGELLGGAAALVHPAPLEGFGLTLLEAMAAGVPVLALGSAVAEEVCGDAALLVAAGELEGGLERLHGDAALRGELSERGRRRAAEFTWEASARAHLAAYEAAAERFESRAA